MQDESPFSLQRTDMVILSSSTEIDNAIAESEAQISSGEELLDAKEVLGAARRKYFG